MLKTLGTSLYKLWLFTLHISFPPLYSKIHHLLVPTGEMPQNSYSNPLLTFTKASEACSFSLNFIRTWRYNSDIHIFNIHQIKLCLTTNWRMFHAYLKGSHYLKSIRSLNKKKKIRQSTQYSFNVVIIWESVTPWCHWELYALSCHVCPSLSPSSHSWLDHDSFHFILSDYTCQRKLKIYREIILGHME